MSANAFLCLPDTDRYRLARCTVPGGFLDPPATADQVVDVEVHGDRIRSVSPAGHAASALPGIDCRGSLLWPAFVDMHTHLDKGHTVPRAPNPDGTWKAALATVATDRAARWTSDDVERRAEFGLACAYAHGTRAMRTHIDTVRPQGAISWPVLARLRQRWSSRVALQLAALVSIDVLSGPEGQGIADLVASHGGLLGCSVARHPEIDPALDRVFDLARDRGLDLDFHADETDDPAARSLGAIAAATLRHGYEGRVTCGHVCSLALQPDAAATIALVARAGVAIVSLPMCNLYLQDRVPDRTPRWRGITLLHELASAGVRVCLASDNTRDPFHAYGDGDMLEVFREGVRIGQLDHSGFDWRTVVVTMPAAVMGIAPGRIAAAQPAEMILFRARTSNELLARSQSDRLVIRGGRAITAELPDYAMLDEPYSREGRLSQRTLES